MNGENVHGPEGLSMIVYAKDAKNGVGVRLLVNQGQILPVGNPNFKDGVIFFAKRICPKNQLTSTLMLVGHSPRDNLNQLNME